MFRNPHPKLFPPPVNTSGLILHYDSAFLPCYPGSGSTVTNILPSPAFPGAFFGLISPPTFDASQRESWRLQAANGARIDVTGTTGAILPATLITWVRHTTIPNGLAGDDNTIGYIFDRPSVSALNCERFPTAFGTFRVGYHWNSVPATYGFDSGLVIPNLEWFMCSVVVTSTQARLGLLRTSGFSYATNVLSHSPATLSAITLGADPLLAVRYFDGHLGKALIYNRALSDAELEANFAVDRARFGV